MSIISGRYLCSEETLLKTEAYLKALANGTIQAGSHLAQVLAQAQVTDFKSLNAKQLLAFLMNTRKPRIFAESEPSLDGSDWNLEENALLGDIVFSTTGTHAFNNGAHSRQVDHEKPLDTHFLFVAGALLRNGRGHETSDMKEVLAQGRLDEEAFYTLYERRLLPGLLAQNEQARKGGFSLVINIPGIGCGQFAGDYGVEIRAALPRVLKRLFEQHAAQLDRVHTVNYDPYLKPEKDEFTTDKIPNTQIRLMSRPLQGLPAGAPGTVASQLEFPKDGTDYTHCRLVKVVAWDHFSFPGNDIWVNKVAHGNGRATDDGVSFASSDVILALFALGQLASEAPVVETTYNSKQGIVYALDPKTKQPLGYQDLAKAYSSNVRVDMIDVLPTLLPPSTQNTLTVSLTEPEVPPQEPATTDTSSEVLTEPAELQKNRDEFEIKKIDIQNQFLTSLSNLKLKLQRPEGRFKIESEGLHEFLLTKQAALFLALNKDTREQDLRDTLTAFRNTCHQQLEIADKMMGYGWLYHTIEVLIKAIVGLFAGIGMVLGSLIGQGLAKAEHRKQFAHTFFRMNQSPESQALAQFKQQTLGDEEEPGLISEQQFIL